MPVRLPSGIVFVETTLLMSFARAAICSGVSRTIPPGGLEKPGSVGVCAWHGAHRCSITGATSERGADSAVPHARAILDGKGRVMVFITHNTDFGDAYEREGDNPTYFYTFSVDGYAVGIDAILYAMTH